MMRINLNRHRCPECGKREDAAAAFLIGAALLLTARAMLSAVDHVSPLPSAVMAVADFVAAAPVVAIVVTRATRAVGDAVRAAFELWKRP